MTASSIAEIASTTETPIADPAAPATGPLSGPRPAASGSPITIRAAAIVAKSAATMGRGTRPVATGSESATRVQGIRPAMRAVGKITACRECRPVTGPELRSDRAEEPEHAGRRGERPRERGCECRRARGDEGRTDEEVRDDRPHRRTRPASATPATIRSTRDAAIATSAIARCAARGSPPTPASCQRRRRGTSIGDTCTPPGRALIRRMVAAASALRRLARPVGTGGSGCRRRWLASSGDQGAGRNRGRSCARVDACRGVARGLSRRA